MNKLDEMIENVKGKLNEVPHRKAQLEKNKEKDKLKRKIKEYKTDIKELKKTIVRLQNKNNMYKKKDKKTYRKIKGLESRIDSQKEEQEVLEKDKDKLRNSLNFIEGKNNKLSKRVVLLEKKLDKKACRDTNLEEVERVDTLLKELDKTREEYEEDISFLKENINNYLVLIDELRYKNKVINRQKRDIEHKLSSLKEDVRDKNNKIKRQRVQIKELENKKDMPLPIKETKVERVQDKIKQLSNELEIKQTSLDDYKGIEELYHQYKELKEEEKNKSKFEGEDFGYILIENNVSYYVPLNEGKIREITNPNGLYYESGYVCRVDLMKGDKAFLTKVYEEDSTEIILNDKQKKLIKKTKDSKNKNLLGQDFFKEVHKYNSLIISSKQTSVYHGMFHMYKVIKVVNPYDIGIKRLFQLIDNADIIVVRTDAVSHQITNYLKDNKKDDTEFVYKGNKEDIVEALYKKAKEK